MSDASPTSENQANGTDQTIGSAIPAWLMSVALHALVVVSMVAAFRYVPTGIEVEPDRKAGIALVKHAEGEREYFEEDDLAAAEQVNAGQAGVQSPFPDRSETAIDVSSLLPSTNNEGAGQVAEDQAAAPRAGELGGGTADSINIGGSARTEVFGIYGTGSRFVYVFDRSGSMEGFGGRPLRAAKQELRSSLGDLQRIHQFQIIFYNEAPKVFDPQGDRPKLEWADEATKELARAFVSGISASGGTHHQSALKLAIGMKPDVIFFLTDADEPAISAADLRKIRRMNTGAAIHAVEFGFGPQRNRNNFLVRMAEQNGGQHVYVNIAKLPE